MTQIKLRRDTSANFTSKNPVLGVGEPAYETDTKKLKIGDGTTAYTQLEYYSTGGGSADSYTKSETNALLSKKNDNIFDISKFTVVGSPTITDGGVASGFSSQPSNPSYILLPIVQFGQLNSWKIHLSFNTSDSLNTYVDWVFNTTYKGYFGGISVGIESAKNLVIRLGSTDSSTSDILNKSFIGIINPNTKYEVIIEFTGTAYNVSYKINNNEWVTDSPILSTTKLYNNLTISRLGYRTNSAIEEGFSGSIDLKQFSITVDGKEVFNGLMSSTKPIYDAIKANNTELSTFKTETSNDFSAVNSALNEKANLTDLSLKQNKLTAGDNVTLTNLTDGTVRIDAAGGGGSTPSNMVTTDTSQDITGTKSFTTGKITFKNTDSNRKILGEINGSGAYCNYYTDKASGEKPCYLGKAAQNVFNMGIPDLTGVTGRIFANTLTKWNGNNEVGTILDSSNLGSYVDGTTITYTNNKLSATGSASMPSNRYIDLTLGASDSTYTAPANGYFCWSGMLKGTVAYLTLYNKATRLGTQSFSSYNSDTGIYGYCFVPVSNGDVVACNHYATTSLKTDYFRFIYAEGSK